MIKAIFFDVDGTLVSLRTHTVPQSTQTALARLREKGVKLFVATGRPRVMLSHIEQLFPFDGWVTLNGQYCYCGDKILRSCPMERRAVEELVSAAQDHSFACMFIEGEEFYTNYIDEHTHQYLVDLDIPVPPVRDISRALDHDIFQANALLTKETERLLLDKAPHIQVTRWHPDFLDVLPAAGGKDLGVAAMLAHFQIAPQEAMAFGDGENDLTMLLHVGTGIAMGESSPVLKERADYVTSGVDEDGILRALEHFGVL